MSTNSITIANFAMLGFFEGDFNAQHIEALKGETSTVIKNPSIKLDKSAGAQGRQEYLFLDVEFEAPAELESASSDDTSQEQNILTLKAVFGITSGTIRDIAENITAMGDIPVEVEVTNISTSGGGLKMSLGGSGLLELTA